MKAAEEAEKTGRTLVTGSEDRGETVSPAFIPSMFHPRYLSCGFVCLTSKAPTSLLCPILAICLAALFA